MHYLCCENYNLEALEVDVTGASSEATEHPSDSTDHKLDHPNHDVGCAESIIWSYYFLLPFY